MILSLSGVSFTTIVDFALVSEPALVTIGWSTVLSVTLISGSETVLDVPNAAVGMMILTPTMSVL